MDFKAIIGIIGAITFLGFMVSIVVGPSPEIAAQRTGDAIAHYTIPWWIKVIQFVVGIPIIGGLIAVGIVIYVAVKR